MTELKTEIVGDLSRLDALEPDLRALHGVAGRTPFDHPAFFLPWVKTAVANGLTPRCVALWRGRDLVGFGPFFVKPSKFGLTPARLSPPLYGTTPFFDLMAEGDDPVLLDRLLSAVLTGDPPHVLVPKTRAVSHLFTHLPAALAGRGFKPDVRLEPDYQAVELGKPGADFTAGLSKTTRRKIRRYTQAMGEAELRSWSEGDIEPEIAMMADVIGASWKNSETMRKQGLDQLTRLARSLAEAGLLRMWSLVREGEAIAYQFDVVGADGVFYALHNAYRESAKDVSPGYLLLHGAIAQAGDEGCGRYETCGCRDYHKTLGKATTPMRTVEAWRRDPVTRVRRMIGSVLKPEKAAASE